MQTPENRSNQILCDTHAIKKKQTKTKKNKKQKGQEQQTERI